MKKDFLLEQTVGLWNHRLVKVPEIGEKAPRPLCVFAAWEDQSGLLTILMQCLNKQLQEGLFSI